MTAKSKPENRKRNAAAEHRPMLSFINYNTAIKTDNFKNNDNTNTQAKLH